MSVYCKICGERIFKEDRHWAVAEITSEKGCHCCTKCITRAMGNSFYQELLLRETDYKKCCVCRREAKASFCLDLSEPFNFQTSRVRRRRSHFFCETCYEEQIGKQFLKESGGSRVCGEMYLAEGVSNDAHQARQAAPRTIKMREEDAQ